MPDIIDWPRSWYKFTAAKFFLRSFSQISVSTWTQRRNVYGPHAQLWFVELALVPLASELWMPMEAVIAQLSGQAGLLRIADPARIKPQRDYESAGQVVGFSDGTFFDDGSGFDSEALPPTIHVVDAASRGDTSIVVGGLPGSASRVLRRNDAFQILPNGFPTEVPHYYAIMKDAPTDVNGETRLEFLPPLREGIAAGNPVVLEYPQSIFRLMDDEQGVFERTPGFGTDSFGSAGFRLVEAIN